MSVWRHELGGGVEPHPRQFQHWSPRQLGFPFLIGEGCFAVRLLRQRRMQFSVVRAGDSAV